MSRRDPGLLVLPVGWLPRRRLTVRPIGGDLELLLRGERLGRPSEELDRLGRLLGGSA